MTWIKYPGGTRSLSAVNNKTNDVASLCYLLRFVAEGRGAYLP